MQDPPADPEGAAGAHAFLMVAARDLDALIAELEPTLDSDQRRLVHRIRLAAESLGVAVAIANLRPRSEP